MCLGNPGREEIASSKVSCSPGPLEELSIKSAWRSHERPVETKMADNVSVWASLATLPPHGCTIKQLSVKEAAPSVFLYERVYLVLICPQIIKRNVLIYVGLDNSQLRIL